MTDAIISEIIKTYDEVKADEMVKYELEDTVFIRLGCYDARYFKRKNCLETKEKTKKRLEDAFYRIVNNLKKAQSQKNTEEMLRLAGELLAFEKANPRFVRPNVTLTMQT